MDLNKAELIGRLTADPDFREPGISAARVYLRLATGRSWKDTRGKDRHHTDFHAVTLFGRLADVAAKYLKKGDRVYVEGSLERSAYSTPGGNLQSRIEIRAHKLIMLGGKEKPKQTGGNDEVVEEEIDAGEGAG